MVNSSQLLSKLRNSKEANVFPLTAAAIFVLAGLVGGGVDMSRAYMVQNRLQNACDAGVLAGRREVDTNGFDAGARAAANNFFNVNFQSEPGTSGTAFSPTSPNNGDTVNGTASTNLNTSIMKLFGFQSMPLSVSCTATMSVGNSDVMMVLDTTGSMSYSLGSQTRIAALQDAMRNFRTTVANATSGSNARIRYGFVPYAHTVNVGGLLQQSWLVDSHTIQSRKAVFNEIERDTDEIESYKDPVVTNSTTNENFQSGYWYITSGSYRNRSQCRANQPSDTSWTNNGAATTDTYTYTDGNGNRVTEQRTVQPQKRTDYTCWRQSRGRWYVIEREQTRDRVATSTSTEEPVYVKETIKEFVRWDYQPVSDFDYATYKTGSATAAPNGYQGANVNYTWPGCIEERDTQAVGNITFSSGTGVSPANLHDLDVDTAPTNDATRWKPMWPELSYYRYTYGSGGGAYYTDAVSQYGSKSQTACPAASRLFSEMTEAQFNTVVNSLSPNGGTYHSIGMIWGVRLSSPQGLFAANVNADPANSGAVARHIIFMTDGEMDTGPTLHSSWGVEIHDKNVTDNGTADANLRHFQRFQAACSIAKSKGIRVWVIAFATALTTELETCASTDSAFTAATSDQLNTAFQEIAKNVGELRVTQ